MKWYAISKSNVLVFKFRSHLHSLVSSTQSQFGQLLNNVPYTSESHLSVTEKTGKSRTYVICKAEVPCPCSRSQPGVQCLFKRHSGEFVTYSNVSCLYLELNVLIFVLKDYLRSFLG